MKTFTKAFTKTLNEARKPKRIKIAAKQFIELQIKSRLSSAYRDLTATVWQESPEDVAKRDGSRAEMYVVYKGDRLRARDIRGDDFDEKYDYGFRVSTRDIVALKDDI